MRVLHTSDWHIGQVFKAQSREVEHTLFFAWLKEKIVAQKIDALLVSGDLFDVANPSSSALKSYYNFLTSLIGSCCKKIIITGGNHDGIATLEAPKELLEVLNIDVISGDKKSLQNRENIIIKLHNEAGELDALVCGVPFLREQVLRHASPSQDAREVERDIAEATKEFYKETLECAKKISACVPVIAMGHLTVLGSDSSESERELYLGKLKGVDSGMFEGYDYVALGHLHRAQKVAKSAFIRYSGSPIPLSFSEANSQKKLLVYDTKAKDVSEIEIPRFRELYRLRGDLLEIKKMLKEIKSEGLAPFEEVLVEDEYATTQTLQSIEELAQSLDILLLEIKTSNVEREKRGNFEVQKLDDITPLSAFEEKLAQNELLKEQKESLVACFKEIEEMVYEDS